MLNFRNAGYQAVADVNADNFDHYGIEGEVPVPEMQSDYAVNVPVATASLPQDHETSLQEARDAIFQSGDEDGIIAYQVVLQRKDNG